VTQEEVANAAAFLASSLSSGITGQTLFVDAGYNIWG
jgi:enoyl-[acyl-carrier protein] reductase I